MSSTGEIVNETVCDLNEKWRTILKREFGKESLPSEEEDEGEDAEGFGEGFVCVHKEGIIVQITGE